MANQCESWHMMTMSEDHRIDRICSVQCEYVIRYLGHAELFPQVNIWSNLTTAYTLVLAVSFIFKSTAQNIFDSTIFLFAVCFHWQVLNLS